MLVAEKSRDGTADVKAHRLSQTGRGKAEPNEALPSLHHHHRNHQMVSDYYGDDDTGTKQHHDEHQHGYPEVETDGEEKTHP